jgi:hypothetical protein
VEDYGTGQPHERFSDQELANNDFASPPNDADQAQRHRNFFSMVFSTDGMLLAGRDVIIRDPDEDQDGLGDRTGLHVSPGPPDNAETIMFYMRDGNPQNIDPDGSEAIGFLITDADDDTVAINFPSVDGLLVYDDSLFRELSTGEDKRKYLLDSAQPLYVSRWTGVVILGPIGETEAVVP